MGVLAVARIPAGVNERYSRRIFASVIPAAKTVENDAEDDAGPSDPRLAVKDHGVSALELLLRHRSQAGEWTPACACGKAPLGYVEIVRWSAWETTVNGGGALEYVSRLVDPLLTQVLGAFPAAMIVGPRASGKTTTAQRRAGVVVALDDPPQAAAFRADPTAALGAALRRAGGTPQGCVLLDEWQEVPDVLGAVKRLVDRGAPAGSFLLTGSVRAALESASWPGTGRVIHVEMYPMTVGEQRRTDRPVGGAVAAMFDHGIATLSVPDHPPDLVGYVEEIVAGGYPPVLGLAAPARGLWMGGYVDQLVQRDVPELGQTRDPSGARRLLRALVENTAGITADTEIASAAGVDVKTVRRHERLLDDLRVVTALPAWHTNRISRLTKTRKRYVIDPGLAANVLGVDPDAILTRGDLLGRLLDTFVMAQIRPLLALGERPVRAYHLRQQDGRHEIDVVLERADGRICALEIKAGASPTPADARHLSWLRDQLGEQFTVGAVLHTGPGLYQLGDRITACPIAALWG